MLAVTTSVLSKDHAKLGSGVVLTLYSPYDDFMKLKTKGDRLHMEKSASDKKHVKLRNSTQNITITEQCTLTPEEYAFFTRCTMKEVEKKHRYGGVKLGVNAKYRSSSYSGSRSRLKESLLHAKVPVNLSPLAIQFLQDAGKGAGILETLIGCANVFPYFSTDSLSLLCSHDNAQYAQTAALKISSEIVEKEIEFPPFFFTNVADSPKFVDFKQKMRKTYAYACKVEEVKLKLVCRREILAKLLQLFEKFVAEECSVTERILLRKCVWQLFNSPAMEEKWSKLKEEMKMSEIDIVTSSKSGAAKPFLKIKGERDLVEKMKEKILELQKSVKEEQITISRPGMVHYFCKDPAGQTVLKGVENEAKVCIELEVKKDEMEIETASRNTSSFKKICSTNTNKGVTINVYVGDITKFTKAEVIVNAANEDLVHGAGVAGAIADCGGSIIRKDSTDHVRKHGKVATGSAVIFHQVGNLPPPYKAIVHAVGPRWNSFTNNEKEIALLRKAVKTSLKLSRNYSSIAIPAISGGVFGFPPGISADTLVKGVAEFLSDEGSKSSSLTDIHFIVFHDNAQVFAKAIDRHFENALSTAVSAPLIISSTSSLSRFPPTHLPNEKGELAKIPSSRSSIDLSLSDESAARSSSLQCIKVTKGDILQNQVL